MRWYEVRVIIRYYHIKEKQICHYIVLVVVYQVPLHPVPRSTCVRVIALQNPEKGEFGPPVTPTCVDRLE